MNDPHATSAQMTGGDIALFGGIFLVLALVIFGIYMLLFGGSNPNWTFRIYALLVVVFGMFGLILIAG